MVVISAGYATLATLWILFSDHALALFATSPESMTTLSVYKGLAFVAVTSGFLCILVRRTYGAIEARNAELRRHQATLTRLNRLNAALSHINQAIVRLPMRDALLTRVCEVLVADGGFRLAWVGWHEPETARLLPVAARGAGADYVSGICVFVDERPEGKGPAGRAFRSGAAQVCPDTEKDPSLSPWREEMLRWDMRSAVALPIRDGGRVSGVLMLYSAEADFFQENELKLLSEATNDVSFALDNAAREVRRRHAEERAEAERLFSDTMIDSMPGVLYFYDETGSFLRWNRSFERVSGYSRDEIGRMHPLDFFEPAQRPRVRARIADVFRRGECAFEAPFRTKDGRTIPTFFTGRRIEFEGRACVVGGGIDITERKQAEQAQHESEERFRATFEQAAVGIAHIDPDGRFRWVNTQLGAITGFAREELQSLAFVNLVVPEDRADIEEAFRAMLAGEREEFSSEKRLGRKDGGVAWVSIVAKMLRDAAGAPKYSVAVVADISERRRLEQQFLRAQRLESIGTLAGGIAHDLNNLLAPIMMGIELLRLNAPSPSAAPVMDNMERSARRAASLVRQVLSFARGVEGSRARLDLADVVREVEGFVTSSFPRSIVLRCELAPDLWPVMGDATQLNQVLLNLCVNARDALAGGGRLGLRAANVVLDSNRTDAGRGETPGRHVLLEVSDAGCGMSPQVRERIFEPFFTTKAPGKGTGLGLSTVLGIVRSHGGRVEVESEPGRGTTFRIFLPAMAEDAATEAGSGMRTAIEKPVLGRGECILVVDDESSLLEVTRQALVAFGYRVLPASDGGEALALFERHQAEVTAVVADLRLATMDGPALVAALRRIAPDVRVIGIVGQAGCGDWPQDEARPDFLLPKPYAADTLLSVLRKVLAPGDGARPR